jgi:DNA oxidative demethylase
MNGELFGDADVLAPSSRAPMFPAGAQLLPGFALARETPLLGAIDDIIAAAPLRHMLTPGGRRMSVAMTNCGAQGWISDASGYRYAPVDPLSAKPWPAMPALFRTLACDAAAEAGYHLFDPNACLINCYEPGARMALHQDRDEQNFDAPIVSVSLGLTATFQFGGLTRSDPVQRIPLVHGDVFVWGGPSRLAYHGILSLKDGVHAAVGRRRINLTFRVA